VGVHAFLQDPEKQAVQCRCARKHVPRVGQNHKFIGIYGVCTVFLAGNYNAYGRIRCRCTVLANPTLA